MPPATPELTPAGLTAAAPTPSPNAGTPAPLAGQPTGATGATNPAASASPATALPPPKIAPIAFERCFNFECAKVRVPQNYRNPDGDTISLFVSRRAARVPANRIGTLFLNPGGPGGATFDLIRSAERLVTSEVLDRFDLIGVDPRGTARSTPLTCNARRSLPNSDFEDTPPEAKAARITSAAIAQRCAAAEGTRLDFMDTETAARDLDAVRIALGEESLSYLGISYGTYLGAVYQSLFPERSRAFVLDSAIDPARFGAPIVTDRLEATERALDGFLAACADGRLKPCAFSDTTDLTTGASFPTLAAKFNELRRRLAETRRSSFELDDAVSGLIGYPRNGWPVLGRALQEAWTTGRANFNQLATDSKSVPEPSTIEPFDTFSSATNIAVNCRDGIINRDLASYITARDAIPTIAPRFASLVGDALVAVSCLDWASPLATLVPLRGTARTLVVANTFDLTTPIRWSRGLAATLNAPLLIRDGGGHGAVDKSACVRENVARFLIGAAAGAPAASAPTEPTEAVCPELIWQ